VTRQKVKFSLGILIIIGTLSWLAFSGFEEGKAYYVTVEELNKMGEHAYQKRLKVAGNVAEGSIERKGAELDFKITQNEFILPVHYSGHDPVPDTFKDGIQTVVEGKLNPNGIFLAKKIQAKCASKYEAKFEIQNSKIKVQNDKTKSKI
jgi:cytochrome c-type biogenesis protein CcmE